MYCGENWVTLREWLDTPEADEGLNNAARRKLWDVLQEEDVYQTLSGVIVSPPPCDDPQVHLARSYRALNVLKKDLVMTARGFQHQSGIIVTGQQAGLLTKQVLYSLDKPSGILIHKRVLLDALLDAYPDRVVSAASAGGKNGMEAHLRPLMRSETCHQTLPTLTTMVLYGCTGKKGRASAERTAQATMADRGNDRLRIKEGHRRKFINVLSKWGFLTKLAQCIVEDSETEESIGLGEEACEAILTIVECIGYPDTSSDNEKKERELVDESMLLKPLGTSEWWDPLMNIVSGQNASASEASRVAATRTIVGIFGLATGHSTRVLSARAPISDATEKMDDIDSAKVEKEVNSHAPKANKMREWGLTSNIHRSLVSHVPELLKALTTQEPEEDTPSTVYLQRHDDMEAIPLAAVPHPGRVHIVPFTSWRLQVVTLLAELVSYDDSGDCNDKHEDDEGQDEPIGSSRLLALDALMKLPLSMSLCGKGDDRPVDQIKASALNPWPTLCDWVFDYPENNLYHVQFFRLFQSICMEHHDSTLRVVLQKAKFVSRAVRQCEGALEGILLDCLNVLRLRSLTLAPSAFLRQFLQSHDMWKHFRKTLIFRTKRQVSPIGSQNTSELGIDLGSLYALKLGLEGFVAYTPPPEKSPEPTALSTPRKASKRKKKKGGKKTSAEPVTTLLSTNEEKGEKDAEKTPVRLVPAAIVADDDEEELEA